MKRNIIKNKAKLSSSDIQKGKNFDELYNTFQKAGGASAAASTKPFYKKGWFTGGVATAIIAVTTAVILNMNKKETVESPLISDLENKQTDVLDSAEQLFIKPPVPGVDVVKDRYVVKSGTGGEINHHTGTKITIPANAFVTEDGETVTGDVNIEYREFHDQADIFFSGIPMEYDSAGSKSVFESAGMMEIRAYQNGKRLKVAPEKNFLVCMHSKNPDPKFNIYHLNEEDKKWDFKGKDTLASEEPLADAVEINEVLESPELIESEKAVIEQEKVVAKIKKEVRAIEKKAPKKPTKVREDKYSFDLDVNATEFPEIAQYNATVFEAINQSTFDPKVYEVQWEDIELTKGKDSEYTVKLTKGKREEKIKVKPVFDGKDYDKVLKAFDKKFEVYKEELVQRKADEKKAEEELVAKRAKFKKDLEELRERQAKAPKNFYAQNNMKLTRTFSINTVGYWNSDQGQKRGKQSLILASIELENGKQLYKGNKRGSYGRGKNDLQAVSVIELDRNRAIKILHWEHLQYVKGENSIMVGVTRSGDIVYSQLLNGLKEKGTIVKVKKLDSEDPIKDLKTLIKA